MKCLQSMITSFSIKVPSNDQKWNAINQLRTTSALVNQWQVLFNLSEFLYPHLTQSEFYTKCLGGRGSDANKYFFLELLFLTKNEIMNIMTRYSASWLWIGRITFYILLVKATLFLLFDGTLLAPKTSAYFIILSIHVSGCEETVGSIWSTEDRLEKFLLSTYKALCHDCLNFGNNFVLKRLFLSYMLWISHAVAILLKTVQNYHPSMRLGKDGQMWVSVHSEEKKEEEEKKDWGNWNK